MSEYKPPEHLSETAGAVWLEIVKRHGAPEEIMGPEFDAYCVTVARARDAARRIDREGAVVNDERGNAVEHPAFAIERKAQAAIKAWGDRFAP
ncbi:P27 family phage terminase small subunit [Rhodococcus sp. NPDC019627]|uniref:P27 family phage terminase small subunit n=1 Tax=unclassified Rhodococcus (in: high G+C Gram-positive bacteria) TaxID=192944 RepID=UPI00378D5FA7